MQQKYYNRVTLWNNDVASTVVILFASLQVKLNELVAKLSLADFKTMQLPELPGNNNDNNNNREVSTIQTSQ